MSLQPEQQGIGAGTILRRNPEGGYQWLTDEVTIEKPLEIRIDQEPVAVTMRTPGNDEELAAGFLLSEGVVTKRADISEIASFTLPESLSNVVSVKLAPNVEFNPTALHHFGTISSSCGLCGKTSIESIHQQFPPIDSNKRVEIDPTLLLSLPQVLHRAQGDFARTGGIHGAGIFDSEGNLLVVREDVGRHNAVDKSIGSLFLDNMLPLDNHILVVSGRASFEIMQKALAARIPIVVAVSAPSSLAVNFARESGQTLVGFLRPPTFNLYSHIYRVAFEEG
jgi:FdhD protein